MLVKFKLPTPEEVANRLFWFKIEKFQLDDPNSSYKFSDRLAYENGWTKEYALRVIEEYKKFIFLCCIHPPATPSDPVDQCWHLHLLYTRNYWNDFCKDTLGKDIHHGPTKGGGKEQVKFKSIYDHTHNYYRKYFGELPSDIWQDNETRFKDIHFKRVNVKRNWVIPKPDFSKIKQLFGR